MRWGFWLGLLFPALAAYLITLAERERKQPYKDWRARDMVRQANELRKRAENYERMAYNIEHGHPLAHGFDGKGKV